MKKASKSLYFLRSRPWRSRNPFSTPILGRMSKSMSLLSMCVWNSLKNYELRYKFKSYIETRILDDCVINSKVILKKFGLRYKFKSCIEKNRTTL